MRNGSVCKSTLKEPNFVFKIRMVSVICGILCMRCILEYGDLDQPMKGKVPFFRIPYANRKVYRMESPQGELLMYVWYQ